MNSELKQARDQAADAECGESPVRNSFFIKGFDCCYSLMAEELTTLRKQVAEFKSRMPIDEAAKIVNDYLHGIEALEQHAKGSLDGV